MSRIECATPSMPRAKPARLVLVAVGAASLAACAQSPVGRQRADLGISRQVSVERRHETRSVASLHTRARHHAAGHDSDGTKAASHGVASFYSEDSQTASGEKFDKNELTAAHPTLPFGTKLRVTNESTGRSVTVRVNDRGPYVRGRVVDVSYSAAEALGMVGQGVANVRLDVVQ